MRPTELYQLLVRPRELIKERAFFTTFVGNFFAYDHSSQYELPTFFSFVSKEVKAQLIRPKSVLMYKPKSK